MNEDLVSQMNEDLVSYSMIHIFLMVDFEIRKLLHQPNSIGHREFDYYKPMMMRSMVIFSDPVFPSTSGRFILLKHICMYLSSEGTFGENIWLKAPTCSCKIEK